jgi:hypothetical protein
MTNVGIVSTSINPFPKAYAEWVTAGDLIVAGDKNSRRALIDYVEGLGGTYIATHQQEQWSWSEYVGWNCIQRRNAAIMEAMIRGYEFVVTVDDDNFPLPTAQAFVQRHIDAIHHRDFKQVIRSTTNFVNTGLFCRPQFHQRGVPYGVDTYPLVWQAPENTKIVVSQAQVLGDPDCDAVERICNSPNVIAVSANCIIGPGVYAAFNSQATMWTREWLPVMAVLPGIGRYDDIFASFIFARLSREYNTALFVGEPCVRQVRNDHNLADDLRAEVWGMDHVFTFTSMLDAAHISSDMPLHVAYGELILACERILPPRTVSFAREWVAAWRDIITP